MSSAPATREFRRATPADALALGRRLFENGDRVDMQTLAQQLDVGRTTLYRWVGDRDTFLGQVVIATIASTWLRVRSEVTGTGLDRTLDSLTGFIEGSLADQGLRGFVQREPTPALRVLMNPNGLVATAMVASLAGALTEDTGSVQVSDEVLAVVVHTATALVWGNVAGGLEPQVTATVGVLRTVLEAHVIG